MIGKKKKKTENVKQEKQEPILKEVEPQKIEPEIITRIEEAEDRMMRYARNPTCKECGAHPVICIMRRGSYAAFRCRECGHRFEVNR